MHARTQVKTASVQKGGGINTIQQTSKLASVIGGNLAILANQLLYALVDLRRWEKQGDIQSKLTFVGHYLHT